MKTLSAFMKKEWMEQFRSGRFAMLGAVFVLLGIMNPAFAKLTPWLFDMMADSLETGGIIVTEDTVSAMDSWGQFFKNIPMGLVAFLLLESNIYTKEYQTGTLVLALTKGLERYKVLFAKATVLLVQWTICYWICCGITYGYNSYFWDNSIARNLVFSLVLWWLFGLWTVILTVFFSAHATANTGVLLGVGGVVLVSYFAGLFPKVREYTPTLLTDSNALIYGAAGADFYRTAVIITVFLCFLCLGLSVFAFNKKQI